MVSVTCIEPICKNSVIHIVSCYALYVAEMSTQYTEEMDVPDDIPEDAPELEEPAGPPSVCDFSGPSDGMAVCDDSYNKSYDMGVEWAYVRKTIDLAPCCPKGKDCGYSCKTDDGIKPDCYVETREVLFLEREEKGYCEGKCEEKCGRRNKKCMEDCMELCKAKKGNPYV